MKISILGFMISRCASSGNYVTFYANSKIRGSSYLIKCGIKIATNHQKNHRSIIVDNIQQKIPNKHFFYRSINTIWCFELHFVMTNKNGSSVPVKRKLCWSFPYQDKPIMHILHDNNLWPDYIEDSGYGAIKIIKGRANQEKYFLRGGVVKFVKY